MALVDAITYEGYLPDWDYYSLGEHIVTQMRMGRIVAWNTPESKFTVALRWCNPMLNTEPSHRFHSQLFRATGPVVIATYDSLVDCAQFPENRIPTTDDFPTEIVPGIYRVTVTQTFRWASDEQFMAEKTAEVDFILNLEHADSLPPQAVTKIPFTL